MAVAHPAVAIHAPGSIIHAFSLDRTQPRSSALTALGQSE